MGHAAGPEIHSSEAELELYLGVLGDVNAVVGYTIDDVAKTTRLDSLRLQPIGGGVVDATAFLDSPPVLARIAAALAGEDDRPLMPELEELGELVEDFGRLASGWGR